jgi:UDP-GlcNAc:undecaprenyl-phosphate/decaprenyl-phosphate GlcNAc-1-phosphate transferase
MFIMAFLIALIFALIFTPLAILLALKLELVDKPNTELKTHRKVTPYLGGAAIAISLLITLLVLTSYFSLEIGKDMYGILIGSLIVIFIGIIDDLYTLGPIKKICFQLVAILIVILTGTKLSITSFDIVDGFLTVLWVIGLTNAINLIDIMDGLAAGIVLIVSIVFSILFLQIDLLFQSLLLLALAGSCLGFLTYNFKPAQIFMGDTGSLFLGFILASTSIHLVSVSPGHQSILILMIAFGIPIFETLFVSILRIQNGRSPLIGSKDHFALRMVKYGFSIKHTVLITYSIGILLGATSILAFNYKELTLYFLIGVVIVTILIAKKLKKVDMSN